MCVQNILPNDIYILANSSTWHSTWHFQNSEFGGPKRQFSGAKMLVSGGANLKGPMVQVNIPKNPLVCPKKGIIPNYPYIPMLRMGLEASFLF